MPARAEKGVDLLRQALAADRTFADGVRKQTPSERTTTKKRCGFLALLSTPSAGIAVALSERVRRDGDAHGDGMQRVSRLARHVVPLVLMIGVLSIGARCAAQEVEAPASPGGGRGPIVAPSSYLELNVPVQDRVGLNVYGFYIGNVDVPAAQIDVPIRITNFLKVTPSYLYVSMPASALDEMVSKPIRFTKGSDEQQLRVDGTLKFSLRGFVISDRNMYVRRFLSTADINRYRNRVQVAYPLSLDGHPVQPFASYEAFYERQNGGWNRNRVWTGVTVPLNKQLAIQPSYLYENTRGLRDLNYLMLGVIVNTK
jgi:hypothetical protein